LPRFSFENISNFYCVLEWIFLELPMSNNMMEIGLRKLIQLSVIDNLQLKAGAG